VYGSRERRKELALEPAEGIHALRAVKKMGGFLFYFIFFAWAQRHKPSNANEWDGRQECS
jgi:hypothetical protein